MGNWRNLRNRKGKNTDKTAAKTAKEEAGNTENSPTHYIFASDISGYVSECSFYHDTARSYLDKFNADIRLKTDVSPNNIHYLIWDHECNEVKNDELVKMYQEGVSKGGYNYWSVCQWIKDNIGNSCKIELWLVTINGKIRGRENVCENGRARRNKTINYSKVKFIIINEKDDVEMSVGCTFFTKTSVEMYKNSELFKSINTNVDFNFSEVNLDNFDTKILSLQDYVQIKFMAEDQQMCLEMSDKLFQLKARLLAEVKLKYLDAADKALPKELRCKEQFIETFKQSSYYRSMADDLSLKIYNSLSALIYYLMNKKKYHFQSDLVTKKIQFDQLKQADELITSINLDDLVDVEKVNFSDMFSLEQLSKPILLLLQCDLIEEMSVEKNKTIYKNALLCPLFLLNNSNLKKMIGHAYDVSTFINLREHSESHDNTIKDPVSREKSFGGIVPVREADSWNDFILSKTFFRGKVQTKSYGLMYYVIAEFAKQCEWIEKDIVECLREYAFERIKDSECFVGFTNFPLDPDEVVTVPLACFYCCEISSILFSQDDTLYPLEKLKLFYSIVEYLTDICEHFNFNIDKNYVQRRSTMFKVHYLFAIDESYTESRSFYHNAAKHYLKKFKDHIGGKTDVPPPSNLHYLIVDEDECKELNSDELVKSYLNDDEGFSWSHSPAHIFDWTKSNIGGDCEVELWLVTNSELQVEEDVNKCIEFNETINYKNVQLIIINEDVDVDLSVSCSFSNKTPVEIYKNFELFKRTNANLDFNLNEISLDNFDEKIVLLQDYVQIKFMAENKQMRLEMSDKLSELQARLLSEVALKYLNAADKKLTKEIRSKEQIIDMVKQSRYYRSVTDDMSLKIYCSLAALIQYLENEKIYKFKHDLVTKKFHLNQLENEDNKEKAELNLDDIPDTQKVNHTDIALLDTSILLLLKCDLLDELCSEDDVTMYKNILLCPLFLLKNAKLKKMIGHAYDVSTFINLTEHSESDDDTIEDPASREKVFGGIVPLREADSWNDYVLSKTFFRGKDQSKSYALMYYVIAEFAKQCEWIEQDTVKSLREYAFERMKDSQCHIGFTNFPLYPDEIVPVPLACFYCCEISSVLFSQDEKLYPLEKLKLFHSIDEYFIDICEHFNFDIDKKFIQKRSKSFRFHYVFASHFDDETKGGSFCDTAKDHLKKFNDYVKSNPDIPQSNLHYLIWNRECNEISSDDLFKIYQDEADRWSMSTPVSVCEWIKSNIGEDCEVELWLIAKLHTHTVNVLECVEFNKTIHYNKIKFIIINEDDDIEMSAGCGFFTNTSVEIYKNSELFKSIDTNVDFNFSAVNLDNFDEKLLLLQDYVQIKFMAGDEQMCLEMSDKLSQLKARLLSEVKLKYLDAADIKLTTEIRSKEQLTEIFKQGSYYKSVTDDRSLKIYNSLSALRHYLMDEKNYQIQSDLVTKRIHLSLLQKKDEKEEDLNLDKLHDTQKVNFTDIVSLEESSKPILLLLNCDLIDELYVKENKTIYENTLVCPLLLLKNAKLKKMIGHAYDFSTYINIREHSQSHDDTIEDPVSRKKVFGGIVPLREADTWNDYILSKTFFRGKVQPKSYSLMYYVIAEFAKHCEWIENDTVKSFREYAFERIKDSECFVGFTNLPFDPDDIVTVPLACFYCCEISSILFSQDDTLYSLEKLKLFYSIDEFLIDICEHFNFDIDKNYVQKRSTMFKRHYIFASDYSGSTGGATFYHNNAKDYLQKFNDYVKSKTDVPRSNLHYLIWDHSCTEIHSDELVKIYLNEEGVGGTDPVTVCQWIKNNIDDDCKVELWLVTDGEIGSSEVNECVAYNKTINYSKINFIILNNHPDVDMSVGCSFFTKTFVEIYKNSELFKRINTNIDFNFNEINLDNFDEKIVSLQDYVQIKFMAEDEQMCLEMSDKLSQLKAKLLSEVKLKYLDAADKKLTQEIRSKGQFIEIFKQSDYYRSVTENVVYDRSQLIDSRLSTLINYLMNKKIYEFKNDLVTEKIQFDQLKKEDEEEADLNLDNLPDTQKVNFTDIVSLEESSKPILLLCPCNLIEELWVEKNKTIYKNTLLCPLFLLKNAKLKKMIGHAYDVSTFINLRQHSESYDDKIEDPASREKVFGGIVPLREADTWNDYILSKTFFRGKVQSRSYSLMYYVIAEFAKQCEWIQKDIVECLREYAFKRIKDSKCLIGFTNLPLDPKEFVPVPLACFYCCEISSILFSQDETLFQHEKLKLFYSIVRYLIDICEHFNFDIDTNYVRRRSTMLYYVNRLKFLSKTEDKVYFLLEKVFEKDGIFFVPKLKRNYDLTGFKCMDIAPGEILRDDVNDVNLNDIQKYLHFSYQVDDLKDGHSVAINKNTLRPHYMIDNNNFYHYFKQLLHNVSIQNNIITVESLEESDKIDYSKFISVFKFYIKYVFKFKTHPSLDEFYEYILQKKKVQNKKVRIFTINVSRSIKNVFDLFQDFRDESIETFAKKAFKSTPLEQRIKLEKNLVEPGES